MDRFNPAKLTAVTLILMMGGTASAQEQSARPVLKFGGYVKVDFIQDFDAIGNPYQFKTDAIPVNGTAAADQSGQTTIHAKETRLTADLVEDTPRGKLHAYVEGDFFGDNIAFRLRQAYGEYWELLGGQTWTTFMDFSARPRSLDYEGSDGEIFVRQAMVRWTHPLNPEWKLAVAVEQPGGQFAVPTTLEGSARSYVPDVPVYVRYETSRAHLQFAGILRQIRFDGEGASSDATTAGVGGNVSFRINTRGKSGLMGQFACGEGIGRYVEALSGQNADAVFTSGNNLDALFAWAGVLGYEQHWNDELQSTFSIAGSNLEDDVRLGASTIRQTQDARVNVIWSPYQKVEVGGEFIYGRRENQDGAFGDDMRLQFSMIYKLN